MDGLAAQREQGESQGQREPALDHGQEEPGDSDQDQEPTDDQHEDPHPERQGQGLEAGALGAGNAGLLHRRGRDLRG